MGTRLYVGNLSYGTTGEDLRAVFTECLSASHHQSRDRPVPRVRLLRDAVRGRRTEGYGGTRWERGERPSAPSEGSARAADRSLAGFIPSAVPFSSSPIADHVV